MIIVFPSAFWRKVMSDRVKLILALLVLTTAMVIPFVGLFVGWYKWDAQTGILIMVVSAVVLFLVGVLLLLTVRKHNWFSITLPFLMTSLYTVLPDVLPFHIDDTLVSGFGAVIAYILLLRKDRDAPRWLIVPLVIAVAYAFIGGLIPGPIDDLLVELSSVLVYAIGVYSQKGRAKIIDSEDWG